MGLYIIMVIARVYEDKVVHTMGNKYQSMNQLNVASKESKVKIQENRAVPFKYAEVRIKGIRLAAKNR